MSEPLLPVVSLDHVGIAATGADLRLTTLIGHGPGEGRRMPSGVVVGRFGPADALELVWPGAGGSPIAGFLARRGPGLHHLAFQVDIELGELRDRFAGAGVRVVGAVEPSSDGRPSLFIHPSATGGVLVELVQGSR
jgi:methylmalonyl-CoA/ethylmalonyl-CoA epimerase